MPSSSFTTNEKSIIKKSLPTNYHKILAAGICRIYYAYPDPNHWSYTGLSGALTFGRSTSTNQLNHSFWFKLIDLQGTRGTIWEHELYEDGSGHPGKGVFGYFQERTFWHTFQGDECMIAFVFSNEDEASTIYKKVINRSKYASKSSNKSTPVETTSPQVSPVVNGKKKGGIDKSMIGAPSGFRRVAHMGYDSKLGFTTENVDPSWAQLLTNLSSMGFSKDDISKNEDFIKEFVNSAGGVNQILSNSNSSEPGRSNGPPIPPVSRVPAPSVTAPITSKRVKPPAPPAPRRNENSTPDDTTSSSIGASSTTQNIPPPSRPPPSTHAPSRPAPPIIPSPAARSNAPPPPSFTSSVPAAPAPAPPPAPLMNQSRAPPAPAPPAPPAPSTTAPPPPPPPPAGAPPPPPSVTSLPPVAGDRANLLASIQGKGIHVLKKTPQNNSDPTRNPLNQSTSSTTRPETAEGGGGDLAASLAAALNKRKGTMGDDSDEEEGGSDDEWD